MFTQALQTPAPDPSDSDGVLLALETARALETRGDWGEAARWLWRAADEAEKHGNDARVLVLAHAAADLAHRSASHERAPPRSDSSQTTIPDDEETSPSIPALAPPPSISFVCELSVSPNEPVTGRRLRIDAIRVAVKRSTKDAKSFSVERLETDQPPPPGTIEGMLVLPGEVESSAEPETAQRVGKRSMSKP